MGLFGPQTIAREARRRGIRLLLHSTHLYRNLPTILAERKIIAVRELRERFPAQAGRFLHDPMRYEKFAVGLDYINCSFTEPNAELLYHRSKSEWRSEWVHLALDLALLDLDSTRFCAVSAAADRGKNVMQGRAGFDALFEDKVEDYRRDGLEPELPTHPQAEVLVQGPIAMDYVRAILVPNAESRLEVERLANLQGGTPPVEVRPQLFVWPRRLIRPVK